MYTHRLRSTTQVPTAHRIPVFPYIRLHIPDDDGNAHKIATPHTRFKFGFGIGGRRGDGGSVAEALPPTTTHTPVPTHALENAFHHRTTQIASAAPVES